LKETISLRKNEQNGKQSTKNQMNQKRKERVKEKEMITKVKELQ